MSFAVLSVIFLIAPFFGSSPPLFEQAKKTALKKNNAIAGYNSIFFIISPQLQI
jgi:hypothetical protein